MVKKEAGIYRKKLLNATLLFAQKTKHVNLTKLSKLLYFLDFTHFKQTGYPSIGLRYYAFKKGPVPKEFWLEVKDGIVPEDFKDKLAIIPKTDDLNPAFRELEFRAIVDPDMSIFTPRETKILNNLADIFRDARGRDISEVSHLSNQPWDVTIKKYGENCQVDYLLCVDAKSEINPEAARECLREYFEDINNFGLEPTK